MQLMMLALALVLAAAAVVIAVRAVRAVRAVVSPPQPSRPRPQRSRELVAKVGLQRERGFLYFLRDNQILRIPMKRAGAPAPAERPTPMVVWTGTFTRDPACVYFLDAAGDVMRASVDGAEVLLLHFTPAPSVEALAPLVRALDPLLEPLGSEVSDDWDERPNELTVPIVVDDAERAFTVIAPTLRRYEVSRHARVVIRRGHVGAPEREVLL